jgi:hypothetical protein
MKVTLNIPDDNFHHENHCKGNLRDYIKSALAEMGGCQDPDEHPYFHGLRNVTVKFVKEDTK